MFAFFIRFKRSENILLLIKVSDIIGKNQHSQIYRRLCNRDSNNIFHKDLESAKDTIKGLLL